MKIFLEFLWRFHPYFLFGIRMQDLMQDFFQDLFLSFPLNFFQIFLPKISRLFLSEFFQKFSHRYSKFFSELQRFFIPRSFFKDSIWNIFRDYLQNSFYMISALNSSRIFSGILLTSLSGIPVFKHLFQKFTRNFCRCFSENSSGFLQEFFNGCLSPSSLGCYWYFFQRFF